MELTLDNLYNLVVDLWYDGYYDTDEIIEALKTCKKAIVTLEEEYAAGEKADFLGSGIPVSIEEEDDFYPIDDGTLSDYLNEYNSKSLGNIFNGLLDDIGDVYDSLNNKLSNQKTDKVFVVKQKSYSTPTVKIAYKYV